MVSKEYEDKLESVLSADPPYNFSITQFVSFDTHILGNPEYGESEAEWRKLMLEDVKYGKKMCNRIEKSLKDANLTGSCKVDDSDFDGGVIFVNVSIDITNEPNLEKIRNAIWDNL